MPFTRPPQPLYPHPRRPVHGGTHMTTYHDLTGFRRDCLQAIAAVDGEPYGRALQDWLDDHYSEPVNHGRLYQNLDRLVEADLVQTTETATDDERRVVYTLTDTGYRLLEAHAGELAQLQHQGTLVADGGLAPERSLDPFVCPRGHHSLTVNATRFSCQTCFQQDQEPSNWDKAALVDLREQAPPEDDRDHPADGGPTGGAD